MARFNESKVQKAHLLAAKVDAEEKVIDLHESYRVQVLEIIKAEPEAQNAGTAEGESTPCYAVMLLRLRRKQPH